MYLRILSIFLLFVCSRINATPYRIIVISPGEIAQTDALTSGGEKRAAALVGFFLGVPPKIPAIFEDMVSTHPNEAPLHPITYIGAPPSLANIQTISPLANVIFFEKAPISFSTTMPESISQFTLQKLQTLKHTLYNNVIHDGKTAILCSKSQEIPQLFLELEPRLKNNDLFQRTFSSETTPYQAFVLTYKENTPTFYIVEIH